MAAIGALIMEALAMGYHSEMRKAQPLDYEDKETHDAPHGSPVHSSHVHSSALAIVFQATN